MSTPKSAGFDVSRLAESWNIPSSETREGLGSEVVPEWPMEAFASFHRRAVDAPSDQLVLIGSSLSKLAATQEQIETISSFIAQALANTKREVALALATRRLTQLQGRVTSVEERTRLVEDRLSALEAAGSTEAARTQPIDWGLVHADIASVAAELGWSPAVQVDEENQTVAVTVPASQEDLLVEGSLLFYERLASALGPMFQHIRFELDVEED